MQCALFTCKSFSVQTAVVVIHLPRKLMGGGGGGGGGGTGFIMYTTLD